MNAVNFQLKGSVVTAIVLELYQFHPASFTQKLQEKVQQAPTLFDQSAVVISLEKLSSDYELINFESLIEQCRAVGMQPIAFRGGKKILGDAIRATGLAWLPAAGTRHKDRALETPVTPKPASEPKVTTVTETVIETRIEEKLVHSPSKVLTRPVRSGQQFYAEGADLIVMTQVSEGAEVLADGHIHVYGSLRGRALAGVKGNKNARVFCQSMEAELISIAGVFMLSDELRDSNWKQPCTATLVSDKLLIEKI